jgi:ribosomal protein L12E/L44/L45/RPP1/RPP2
MEARMRWMVVAFASTLVTGCALHLHSPGDAKQAQAVIATYEKVDLDGVVSTARSNSTAVSRAERDAVQKLQSMTAARAETATASPGEREDRAG